MDIDTENILDMDTENILDKITDQCMCRICEEKELQKVNIIKYLEKHKFIIGILSAMVISIIVTTVIIITLIILMGIPLEILL